MSQIQMHSRRGMLELDVIFERFLKNQYNQLSEIHKQLFSRLLKEEDPTLYDWLISGVPCTDATLQEIVQYIRKIPPVYPVATYLIAPPRPLRKN